MIYPVTIVEHKNKYQAYDKTLFDSYEECYNYNNSEKVYILYPAINMPNEMLIKSGIFIYKDYDKALSKLETLNTKNRTRPYFIHKITVAE